MASYWGKLKDPRWQKKRLEIFERDGWRCLGCGETTETLHVHHGFYQRDTDPWEYESKTLHTLCEHCHEVVQERLRDVHYEIAQLGPQKLDRMLWLLGAIRNWKSSGDREFDDLVGSIMDSVGAIADDVETWRGIFLSAIALPNFATIDSDIAIGNGCGV